MASMLAGLASTTGRLVVDGDSIPAGWTIGVDNAFGAVAYRLLGSPVGLTLTNVALAGQTTAQMRDRYASAVRPLVSSGDANLIVVHIGTNDFGVTNVGGLGAYAALVEYARLARRDGFDVLVVIPPPRSGPNASVDPVVFESERQKFAEAVAAHGASIFARVCDPRTDVAIGVAGCETNLDWFLSDRAHPSALAHAHLAVLLAPTLAGYLRAWTP